MTLFQLGDFILASGHRSKWKIDCDALTSSDWAAVALLICAAVPRFGSVEGVPDGGVRLANAMDSYVSTGPLLIVDDVWTTGQSWYAHRGERTAIGAVLFARNPVPPMVTAVFTLTARPR